MKPSLKVWILCSAIFVTVMALIQVAQADNSTWYLSGGNLRPNVSTWGLTIPALANQNCIGTDANGVFGAGSCSGGGSSTFGTSSLSALWPIIYTKSSSLAQFSFGGLSTTSNLTQGYVPYVTGANTFGQVATGTITCTGTASCNTSGLSVLGGNLTINATGAGSGLATTTPIANSNLLVYSTAGAGAAYGVATSTLTPSSPLTGSFVQIGSSGSLGLDTSGTWTGNAGSATKLQTARAINGVNFDGTAAITIASTTLLGDSNTFSGTLDSFSNPIKVGSLAGFIGGNGGTLYAFSTSTIKTSQLTNDAGFITSAVTSVTGTYPIISSGGNTPAISTAFGTTSNTGLTANQFVYTDNSGIFKTAASSSFFGYTPVPPTRNVNTSYPLSGGGALSGDLTLTFSGLSTSSPWTTSNLAYVSNGNTLASVATSTLTASSPLTGNFIQVGSGGSLGCQSASGSQNGCLVSTDWLTFNNKVATGTNFTSSNIPYFGSNGTLFNIATSSETCTSPLSCSSFLHIGSGGAISINQSNATTNGYLGSSDFQTFNNKIGTSSNATAGRVAYFTTTSGTPALLADIATGTITCTGNASCATAGLSVLGGNLTINASGGTGSGLATTTPISDSNLLVYSASGAGSAYGVSTSTLSPSSPLGGSFTQVGSGGSITCTTAASGVAGCLNSTDWATFNNKISSTSLSGSTIISYNSSTGVITTTPGTFGGSTKYTFPGGLQINGPATSTGTFYVTGPFATTTSFYANGLISCNGASNALTWSGGNFGCNTITGTGSGLSTSSPIADSNLLVYSASGAGSAYGVSTSTLSASSPLTGSFTQIGSGGSLGIQVANSGQNGYLSSGDWSTFNNKIGWGQATSTSANQIVYTNNAGLLVSVASSSLSLPNSALQNSSISGVALGSNLNTLTFNSSGGAAANSTYNGSGALTVDYHTVGAQVAGTYLTGLGNYATTTGTGISISTTTLTVNGLTYGNTFVVSANGILVTPTVTGTYTGQAGSVANALTISSPLTGSSYNGSAGVSIGCTNASSGVTGCLTGTDWNTFNNKISWGAATSTSANQFVYTDNNGKLVSVASSSIKLSGFNNDSAFISSVTADSPLSGSGTSASHLTIQAGSGSQNGYISSTDWNTFNNKISWGAATSTSANQVVYTDALGKLTSTASSSETCTAPLSCGSHDVLKGGGAITITQSGTGANGYLSSTDFTTFNNKISSSSLSGGSVISYNSSTGVITTTPGTFAGSSGYTFPSDLIAGGANTDFFFSNALVGLGLGTSTPTRTLTVASSTAPQIALSDALGSNLWTFRNAGGNLYIATSTYTATSTFSAISLVPTTISNIIVGASSTVTQSTLNSTAVATFFNEPAGTGSNASSTLVIGDTSTTTSVTQLQLNNSAGVTYCIFVNNAGTLTTQSGKCN